MADEPREPRAPQVVQRKYVYTPEALARQLGLTGKVLGVVAMEDDQLAVWTEADK